MQMMSWSARCGIISAVVVSAFLARAEMVSEDTARIAANGFLSKSSVAKAILAGRSVDSIEARGSLWIARLAPSGYIELAGSTKCAPVLSFSAEDFTEPEAGSPLAAKLLADSEWCEAKEADSTAADNAQWKTLLSAATSSSTPVKRLLRAATPSATTSDTFVDSFIGARWSQGSPMSDLTPRRSPCGCVATAAGQEFRYWQWPYRFESVDTFTHTLVDANGDGVPYVIRLDGRVAIDWDKVAAIGGSSTPYAADKTTAYNTALLTAWMQEFGGIVFKAGAGSGSRKVCSSAETAWYEAGPVMSRGRDGYDNLWAAVTNDLAYGSPIQINTPVHQMVIDGYAVDNAGTSSEVDWINTNYGWGNPTSWENFDTVTTTGGGAGVFADFQTGFRPMKIVQFEPVPRVSNSTVPLTWHIAPCYTNKINGFAIQIDKFTDATSLIDDFSASAGTASSDKFKVEDGYLGGYPAIQDSTYTYPNTYFATSSASLTFNTKSRYMNGHTATVEVKANSGSWTTVYTIALTGGKNTSYDTPVEHNIDLSAYAGKAIQLRFRFYCTWAGYTAGGSADFRIDDVSLTGVKGVATTMNTVLAYDATYPSVYSYTAEELESGSSYAFTVAPFMSDQSEARANTVTTTIGTPAAAPAINSVSSIAGGIDLVQEGFFIECARGAINDITVTCSESTTSLSASPSHLSILPDEKVTVEKSGNVFTVHVDATDMMSTKKFWDGDMLILTLVATNNDGTEAYKNLMLRFNSMRQVLGGDYEIADTSVDSAVWFCGDTTLDAKGQDVTFAASAFMGAGCTVTLTDSIGGGSFTFAGLDGFTGTLAFAGALDVTLPQDMSGFSGTLGITDGTYTLNRDLPATATLELGESMPTVYLGNATIAGAITGYGEVYVTNGTCAVTGSIGAGAYVMLSGGTLELAQGLEPRVGQTGGTLKIQLTPYQTAYGYSALIQNYASGTILLVDSDGNEITPTISGDPAVFYPPTLATTTASYTGNANVWTGTDAWVGGKYSTASLWSKNALPSDGDYVIFNDASTDGFGALMSLNAATAVNLGYVKVTGNTYFEIDTFSSDTSAIVTAGILENEISTKLDKEYFQPLAVVPRAKLLIANGMKFACEIDYTLATNLKTRNYTTSGEYNAIQYSHAWEGTVVFTNYTASGLNPSDYGNSNSVVRLSGVEGWLANNKEYLPTVELVDYGTKPALKWDNGSASSTVIFDAISGDGTFQTASPNYGGKESVVIKDVSKFTGSFNLAAKKVAIADAMPSGVDSNISNGRLFVCKAATVASGANWWANGGIHLASGCDLTVNGTLDATSMLTNDSDNATLTLDGGVLKVSSALKGGHAPTLNFKSGTYQITADISESSTVNFCADAGEYTTLDANGHKLTLPASFFSGSGDIYLTSSAAGGSFIITGISTDYTGTIYAEESLKVTYPDDLSTQGGIINIAGATLAYSSAKLGNVRVDEGGTLTIALTDEQAMTSFDATSLVTLAGGVVEFVDSYGTIISSSSESAAYTRPASYTLAPSATAVWISGEFKDAASEHGGYEITTNMAGEVNSAGNIVIGGDSSYIGATLNLSTVTNCTKASVLVKFKSSLTGAPADNAAIMGVISSDGCPISPICTTEGGTAFAGAYLNKDSSYALVTGKYPFSTTPTYPTSGSGYMLFSYQSDQGSSTVNGTAFYIGDTIETMDGGNRNNLQWRQKTLTSFYIGGPGSTTIPTWKGLEIEAVALFVDEWYAPADVKWYEFPSTVQPEEPPVDEDEYAVEPAAVWCGDFKTTEKGGYTLSTSGTTAIADDTYGSTITIGDSAATIAIPEPTRQYTMLVKYSAAPAQTAQNFFAGGSFTNGANKVDIGLLSTSSSSSALTAGYDNGSAVTAKALGETITPSTTGGYILIAHDAGGNLSVYAGDTFKTLTTTSATIDYKFTNWYYTSLAVGGPSGVLVSNKCGAWDGLVLEKVAIFDGYYTPGDLIVLENPEDAVTLSIADNTTWNFAAGTTRTYENIGTLSASGTIAVTNETLGAGVYKLAEWTTAQKKSTGYGYVGTLSTPGLVPGLTAELVYGAKAIYLRVYDATAQAAKGTLKIWPYGDSITEGFNASDTKANYRVLLGQKLAMLGFNVEMVGCYDKIQTKTASDLEFMDAIDPSGATIPDAWKWHSAKHGGTVGVTAATSYQRSAMLENVDTLCAQVGNPDVVLVHGGINDLYASGETAASVFGYVTNLVNKLVADLPNTKVVVSTLLYGDAAIQNRKNYNSSHVEPFNNSLKELMQPANLPAAWDGRVFLADLNDCVSTYRDDAAPAWITVDNLHPDWWGHDEMAEGWLSVITNEFTASQTFPSATPLTAVANEDLGAAAKTELADYIDGFTLARTIDIASTNTPTVANGEGATENIAKVGYFVEYVRADNEAHKWVWVDMDAFGTTIADLGLPTANHQTAVTCLHVKSNHNGIEDVAADDDSVSGWIEFSPFDYTGNSSGVTGAPTAHGGNGYSMFDWNDTLGLSGTMGSMQVFRLAPPSGRPAQVLFAYNNWQSDSTAAEFGVGNFAQHFWGGAQTLDYTYTKGLEKMNASAYRVKRIEIWTKEKATSGAEGEYSVPYSWINMYFPELVSGWDSSQYDDFATNKNHSSVKNGYAPWQSYVLGLDPTNETSKFTATIRMDGSTPVVEYSPTNTTIAIDYVLQGKPALTNDWQDVDFDTPGDTNRFFRVDVRW